MKALILAAGLGTRLRPYTHHRPKPLFTIDGRPLLNRIIDRLIAAGCEGIVINTHHLHAQVESLVAGLEARIPIHTRYEPEILGTGGAIRNVADFLGSDPFMVVNGDIETDIPFQDLLACHRAQTCAVTMAVVDYPAINTVWVDSRRRVRAFLNPGSPQAVAGAGKGIGKDDHATGIRSYTFTGIQVVDPCIIPRIPAHGYFNIIDLYRELIRPVSAIQACVFTGRRWSDIGTPDQYRQTALAVMAETTHQRVFGNRSPADHPLSWQTMAGDGSDRRWYRFGSPRTSLVCVDHGLRSGDGRQEVDAYIDIGRHLWQKGLPVPQIHAADPFAGMVAMEDFGDLHLHAEVQRLQKQPSLLKERYHQTIDLLINLSVTGAHGFSSAHTYQTPCYDRDLILQKEGRYFMDAFVRGYCGLTVAADSLDPVFTYIADQALAHGAMGFMHRDFQSRNIMVRGTALGIIDFQAGRIGPLQYDLASLLIDPYAALPFDLQETLLAWAIPRIAEAFQMEAAACLKSYRYLAVARNLQIMGAFGFLTGIKHKAFFAAYIPRALQTLHYLIEQTGDAQLGPLQQLVAGLPAPSGCRPAGS